MTTGDIALVLVILVISLPCLFLAISYWLFLTGRGWR